MNEIKRCYLCGSNQLINRDGQVRDNSNLKILECTNCGLVFLSSHDHINEMFYEDSNMSNDSLDLDQWRKETYDDDKRRFYSLSSVINDKTVLDYGCGNGGFIKLIEPKVKYAHGVEPELRSRLGLIKDGFTVFDKIPETNQYDIITLFHVIEHLKDPIKTISELSNYLTPNGKIIIETPNSDDALLTLYKNQAFSEFTYWSCHLYYFNEITLSNIITRSNLNVNEIHQIQRYSLSNHLYWLSNNTPGGHNIWKNFNGEKINQWYETSLADLKKCDTILIIATKK